MPVTIRPDITKFGPGPAQLALEAVTGIAMEVVSTKREKAALEELAVTVETENPFLASVIRAQSKNLSSSSNIGGGGRGPGGGSSAGTFQEILRSAIDAEADQRKFGFDQKLESTSNANMMGRITHTAKLHGENDVSRHELDKKLATYKQILEELPQTPEGKETRDIIQASALFGLSSEAVKINQAQQIIDLDKAEFQHKIDGSAGGKHIVPWLDNPGTPEEIQKKYMLGSDSEKKTMRYAHAQTFEGGLIPKGINSAEEFDKLMITLRDEVATADTPIQKATGRGRYSPPAAKRTEVSEEKRKLYAKFERMINVMENYSETTKFSPDPVDQAKQKGVGDILGGFRKDGEGQRRDQ